MAVGNEIVRQVSVGKTCDINLRAEFITASCIPFLTDCKNVLIVIKSGNQTKPFVKFAYKTTVGYKPFVFETLTDEANGKALLQIESEDTAKAMEGSVIMEMNVELNDTSRVDLGFDTNVKKYLFKFV